MTYMKVQSAVVTVQNYKNLQGALHIYSREVSARFIVEEPLTASQFRRLPAWVRERTKCDVDGKK